jgi:MtN3 and saliva related transmembrane protein
MNWIVAIGYFAALCSMLSFALQAFKIIRSRETKDISMGMYILTVGSFVAWTTYGAALRQWPLVVSNSICLALSAFILTMKVLSRSDKDRMANAMESTLDQEHEKTWDRTVSLA